MKKTLIYLAAAAAVLAACQREPLANDPAPIKTVLSIGANPTKTTIGELAGNERPMYWADGDVVNANGIPSLPLENVPAQSTRSDFSFTDEVTAPYNALYPASIYKSATAVNLPHNAGDQVIPLFGVSESASLSLSPLTGVLQIKVKQAASDPDTDPISLIEVFTDNTRMSGDFSLDWTTGTLTPAASPSGADLTMQITGSWPLSADATSFFIPVPAGSYNFTVKVMDSKGHYMTKATTSPKTFVQGQILPLKEFAFVPTESGGIEIDTPEKLIAFAKAYNNGDYDAMDPNLVATVTADLVFDATTSAAFNATAGIGSGTTYFNGLFDGGNFTISGLQATVPLFANIGIHGTVKDLNIDATSSFTFTHTSSAELQAGTIAGYHKGKIQNVAVSAPVSLAPVSGVAQRTDLGGLVGRVREGDIVGSTYAGAIYVPAGFTSSSNSGSNNGIMIGGIVGWISNTEGKVKNTTFSGTIENEGQLVAAEESNELKLTPYLSIGGIVGNNTGVIESCTVNNHSTGVSVSVSGNNLTGTLVTHSTNAYHYTIAGIAGQNIGTVKACTNNASVLNIFSAGRGSGGNLNGRYVNVAGIVGYNAAAGTVEGNCTNNGTLTDRACPKIHYVGGIVGRNYGSVTSASNSVGAAITVGEAYFDGPNGARQLYLGGCIGCAETDASMTGLTNAADITVEGLENNNTVISAIGGIVGWSKTALDGSTSVIRNSGDIQQTNGNQKVTLEGRDDTTNAYGFYLGGIAGYTTSAISTVSNQGNLEYICTNVGSGVLEGETEKDGGARHIYLGGIAGRVQASALVDVQYCSNEGTVTFDPTLTAPHVISGSPNNSHSEYHTCYLGGIVGYGNLVRIKGDATTKTTNSGNILGGDNSGNHNVDNTFFVGGIVGYVYGRASSVSYCELTGTATVTNQHWSNRSVTGNAPFCGGIVGAIYGANSSISNCSIASTSNVTGTRGDVGGIVGYGRAVTISDCSVSRNLQMTAYCGGGIAGWVRDGNVTNCTFSGTKIRSSQMTQGGGIVGILSGSTVVDACNSDATDVSKNGTAVTETGAIAGRSATTNVIKNCHYKSSSLSICGDSNFTTPTGEQNYADR